MCLGLCMSLKNIYSLGDVICCLWTDIYSFFILAELLSRMQLQSVSLNFFWLMWTGDDTVKKPILVRSQYAPRRLSHSLIV